MSFPFLSSILGSISDSFISDKTGKGALIAALIIFGYVFVSIHNADMALIDQHAGKIENLMTQLIQENKQNKENYQTLEAYLQEDLELNRKIKKVLGQ